MNSFITRIRNTATFTNGEFATLYLYTFIFSLIGLFFTYRRNTELEYFEIILYLVQYIIIFGIIILSISYIQKIAGAVIGSHVTASRSWVGIIFSAFLSFMSSGFFFFFIPPGYVFDGKKEFLIGRFYRVLSHKDYAVISAIGIFSLIIVMLVLYSTGLTQYSFFSQFALVILFYVLYSLIPFDFLTKLFEKDDGLSIGISILYKSRTWYVGTIMFCLSVYALTVFGSFVIALLFSIIISTIIALWYYFSYES